jgi:hypothetical protein
LLWGAVYEKRKGNGKKSCKKKTGRRPKRGAVPQAATGLSAAREEAERLASCERRVGLWIWAEKTMPLLESALWICVFLSRSAMKREF